MLQFVLKSRKLALISLGILSSYMAIAKDGTKQVDKSQYQEKLSSLLVQNQLFTQNHGQWDDHILYQTTGNNAVASFDSNEVHFALVRNQQLIQHEDRIPSVDASILRWNLVFEGGNTQQVIASNKVDRNFNYFGPKATKGIAIAEYKELEYRSVYNQIDLKFYSNESGEMKYDFVVNPGGSIDDIVMRYDGVNDLELTTNGQLRLNTDWGAFIEDKPFSYQMIDGEIVEVHIDYVLEEGKVKFKAQEAYNPDLPLIIDPIYVDWSTFFYGEVTNNQRWGWNWILDVDVDDKDYVYICGMTWNQRFESQLGGYDTTISGTSYDAFVCKITPKGDSLRFFTYIGGSQWEYAMNVSVNARHDVVVSGLTYGSGFPTTKGAFDTVGKSCAGGWCYQGFVTKIDSSGQKLIYSTYLTGTQSSSTWSIDWIRGMQLADNGNVYLVGNTTSEDFPTTTGCYQATYGGNSGGNWWNSGDGWLSCLKPDGSGLVFSTYIGGSDADVAKDLYVDPKGDIYVVGQTASGNFRTTPGAGVFNRYIKGANDAFVVKFKPDGKSIYWAKLMGGSGEDFFESIYATAEGEPYIAGASNSSDFYTTKSAFQRQNGGAYDVVLVKMISAGTNVHYSTYLGGSGNDGFTWNWGWFEGVSVAANVRDEAIIAATSASSNFPVTSDALYSSLPLTGGGFYGSLTISKIDYTGSKQLYGTYYGGQNGEFPGGVKVKKVGCITYMLFAGVTRSSDYPVTSGVYRDSAASWGTGGFVWSGFVSKFRDTLYTEPIALGLQDSIVECDNVFEIFDAKNQGADFLWSDGTKNRFNIVKDSGLVWVQATYGCDTVRDSVHISLEHSPKIPVLGPDTTYCDNFPSLTLDAKNDTIYRSYLWHDGDTTQTKQINQPGKYYVDISTPNCGTKTDTVTFKLLDTPKLDLFVDSIVCDSVHLTVDAANANNEVLYRWSTNDSTQMVLLKDTTAYWVTVKNFCGFDSANFHIGMYASPELQLPNDSVYCDTITYGIRVGLPDNDETYLWEDLNYTSVILATDTITITNEFYGRMTITNRCGEARDSVKFEKITTPTGGQMDTVYACDAVSDTLELLQGKFGNQETYAWSNSSAIAPFIVVNTTGNYTGYVQNKCGVDSSQWLVVLKNSPQAILPNDSTYCTSINVTLDATSADPDMVYMWQDVTGGPTYQVTQPGTYKLKLQNRCGADSTEVNYKLLQLPQVDLGDDTTYCGRVDVKWYQVGDPSNEETYLWSNGNTTNRTSFNTAGNHWASITNYCGVASDTVFFKLSPYPIVDLGPDTILCGDFIVPLDAGNPGMSYEWFPFGETTQKISATEQVTYTVYVTNVDGCTSSDDFTVGTECISYFHVPNAVSPNNDGLNDVFKPTLINYQDFRMIIFDRWGEVIFETEDVNQGWDGKVNGEVVPQGIYAYSIRFITTENGEYRHLTGAIHVLR